MKFGEITLGGRFGGYEIYNKSADRMPQDLATALPNVCNKDGWVYAPIWYWGTQLVNGVNHMLVCERVKDDIAQIVLVVINIPFNSVGGQGASLVSVTEQADLYGDLKKAFDNEMKALCGVGYKAVAFMGEQIVKGTNYYILVEGKVLYKDALKPFAGIAEINLFNGEYALIGIERLGGLGYAFTW